MASYLQDQQRTAVVEWPPPARSEIAGLGTNGVPAGCIPARRLDAQGHFSRSKPLGALKRLFAERDNAPAWLPAFDGRMDLRSARVTSGANRREAAVLAREAKTSAPAEPSPRKSVWGFWQ